MDTSAPSLGIWVSDTIRERYGLGRSERLDFERFLHAARPDDREGGRRRVMDALGTLNLLARTEREALFRSKYGLLSAPGAALRGW